MRLAVCISAVLLNSAFICAAPQKTPDLTGTRVHVPWNDFQRIIERITGAGAREPADTMFAPVDYVIPSCRIEGSAPDHSSVRLTARVTVHVLPGQSLLRTGWVAVPMGVPSQSSGQSVLEQVTVNGAASSMDISDNGQYSLILSKEGTYDITLRYHSSLQSREGTYECALFPPAAVATSVDFLVPGRHAEIRINGEKRDVTFGREGTRLVTAVSGQSGGTRISFTPLEEQGQAGEAAQMTPKVFASTGLLVGIKENRITYRCQVDYEIWHKKRTLFSLLIPDSLPIENITGPGLSQWDISATDSGQRIDVRTSYAPERSWTLTIDYSQKLESAEALLAVPVPRVLDVNRESGCIAVEASPTMEVATGDSTVQVSSVAPSELPSWLGSQPNLLMRLKYNRRPFRLNLAVKRHKDMPVLVAVADEALFTVLQSTEGYRLAKYRYYIRNNQKQYLRVVMPEQWALWSALIDGRAVMPATGDSAGAVLLPLKKSAENQDEGFTLELVYWNADKRMKRGGTIAVPAPVIDINCQKTNLEIWVPCRYRYHIKPDGFETTGYISSNRLSSSPGAWANQQAVRQTRLKRDYMPAQSNTFMVAKKGKALALPVEIEIPTTGVVKRFTRGLTVAGEKAGLAVRYRKAMPWVPRMVALGFWLIVVSIAFFSTRSAMNTRGSRRARGTVITAIAAIIALMFINWISHSGGTWLGTGAVLAIGCAVLGRLAAGSRKGVAV